MNRYFERVGLLLGMLGFAVGLSFLLQSWPRTWIEIVMGAAGAIFAAQFLITFQRISKRNPTPLKIAVVGQPGSGKTVFLTVLFHELQVLETDKVAFQPYGRETIECVASNFRALTSGVWLKSTSNESVFFFRANVQIGRGLLADRYTVEIGDYAGERVREFDTSSDAWLHHTGYFKYVILSDVLFLVADGEILARQDEDRIEEMQQKLIAAFQVLIDEKGLRVDRRLKMPVALLVLKADLFDRNVHAPDVESHLRRLISLCSKRCQSFHVFYVSSIGGVDNDGKPPREIRPRKVVDPMVWALRQIHL